MPAVKRFVRNNLLAILGAAILLSQAAITHQVIRTEYVPSVQSLDAFPTAMAEWVKSKDALIDPSALEELAPDSVLSRVYQSDTEVAFFVAYYGSQHRIRKAHSPKVCLPGAGWNPVHSETLPIRMAADPDPKSVNYYVVKNGNRHNVVLYWYQTHKRVIAGETTLNLARVVDTMTDNRTDMALVRIITPVVSDDLLGAKERAVRFAQTAYPHLLEFFPPRS